MNRKPTDPHSFQFRSQKGQRLIDHIAAIESMATERIRAGVSLHSVRTGALALLQLATDSADVALVDSTKGTSLVQTCASAPESPRCAQEG